MAKQTVFFTIGVLTASMAVAATQGFQTVAQAANDSAVRIEVAAQVAEAHLLRLGRSGTFTVGDGVSVWDEDGYAILYHRFELEPQGYIAVSGDYALPPVIAYSFTAAFWDKTESGNPLSQMLRTDLHLRLVAVPVLPESLRAQRYALWNEYLETDGTIVAPRGFQQWPPEGTTTTGGWLETEWHQGAPYNDLCPIDLAGSGARSVAGCPAVAMAQIFNYRQETNGTRFDDGDDYYHNYAGNQYWIDDAHVLYDFPSFPELNTFLDTLDDHYGSGTPLTNTDKAALVFACGVAAHQVYNAAGSGTFGVGQALDAYTRFSCDTVELLDEEDADLYERLSQNMKHADPAHLAVVNPEWTSGHNVVVDGYNTDEYYHLNFGWGGPYDSWYLLPDDDDMPFGLTVIEGVIVDIMIDDNAIPALSEWGLVAMTLLLLTAATIVFMQRRAVQV